MLRMLIEQVTPEELPQRLVETLHVDTAQARRDVEHFLFRLRHLDLVEGNGADAAENGKGAALAKTRAPHRARSGAKTNEARRGCCVTGLSATNSPAGIGLGVSGKRPKAGSTQDVRGRAENPSQQRQRSGRAPGLMTRRSSGQARSNGRCGFRSKSADFALPAPRSAPAHGTMSFRGRYALCTTLPREHADQAPQAR